MQRIVKRFLLHKQRETDEVSEADFDELKQDLQMVRYEMLNDLKRYREENYRLIAHIHDGILLLGKLDYLLLGINVLNEHSKIIQNIMGSFNPVFHTGAHVHHHFECQYLLK
jgi:hypothetical protein